MNNVEAFGATRIVARFAHSVKSVGSIFDEPAPVKGESHFLELPKDCDVCCSVWFTKIVGDNDRIFVGASNWRCEDEPHAIYAAKDARKLYSDLKKAGFVVAN